MTRQLSNLPNLLSAVGIALFALAILAVPSQQVRGDDPVPCTDYCPNEGEVCINGYCQFVICNTLFCTQNNLYCYWSFIQGKCRCIGDCCNTTLPSCLTCKCVEKPAGQDCECK